MRVFSAKSFWLPVLVATLVAAFFGAILNRRGRYLEQMLVTEARQQRELARLTEQNEKARAERDALLSSPEAIERVAREEYGLAAPGEEVTPFEPLAAARPREAGAAMDRACSISRQGARHRLQGSAVGSGQTLVGGKPG